MSQYVVTKLLNAAATTGEGAVSEPGKSNRAFQVILTGTATVALKASIDGTNWITLRTSTASEGYSTDEPWPFMVGEVTAFTSGTATLLMST